MNTTFRKLKIALSADPEIAVPPTHYGGIERVIDFLVTEYQTLGHEVFLFANKDSRKDCRLQIWPGLSSSNKLDTVKNTIFLTKAHIKFKFDIIHSFSRLAYLSFLLPMGAKCIMSYQREPTISQIKTALRLAFKKNLLFTGCSNYIADQIKPYAPSFTVYNGVLLRKFKPNASTEKNAPLVFLGRIEPIKGAHNAITIAKKSKKKLVIAGNIPTEYQWYFDKEIKPHLNNDIKYVGPVNDGQKNELLRNALAFLMAIEWNEPFGIVMAEATACGTPIIGTCKGAVSEFIIEGMNGYKSDDIDTLVGFTATIHGLDRLQIRKDTEIRFSSEVVSKQYLSLYKQLI